MLVAVLLLALLLAGCGSGTSPEAATESPWQEVASGWSRLPPPPFRRARAAVVWTGREVLMWGGDTEFGGTTHADGGAYEPATGRWRSLSPSPLLPRASAVAVWTGEEMLIWGGWSDVGGGDRADGAAYDPETRTWRMLPAAPLGPRIPVAAVWTGRELLLWGDVSRFEEALDGAAYDPEADRWRPLPPAPAALNEASAAWTGAEMIVFGALLDGSNWSKRKHAEGIAYNPRTDEWRRIAPYAFSPQASWATWTGDELLVWDYELKAAAYDPARDSWRDLPDLPLDFSECYPRSVLVGQAVFAWHCGGPAALFERESSSWKVVSTPADGVPGWPHAAGSVVVFVEASHEGKAGGWTYRP
jgi:hypothetical protein